MKRTSRAFRILSTLGLLALFPSLVLLTAEPTNSSAPQPSAPATPKRVDGFVAGMPSNKPPKWKKEAERIALVRAAMKHRAELIGKLQPPTIFAKRVKDGSIKVDGKLDERVWKRAHTTDPFRLTRELTPAREQTRARLLWDSKYLYIAFECEDSDLIATKQKNDDELWAEDVAEIFIDADRDEMTYLEFEVSPSGLLYDGSCADYRPEIDWPNDLGHMDMDLTRTCYDTKDTKIGIQRNGTFNKSDDTDKGWTCELAISWEDIARGTNVIHCPPKEGDLWRVGIYRCNVHADKKAHPDEYSAWNPTTSWFHVPWVFGNLEFID